VWALTDRRTPRAFSIPYDEETERKLRTAQEKSEQGIPQIIEDVEGRRHREAGDRNKSIRVYDFDMSAGISK